MIRSGMIRQLKGMLRTVVVFIGIVLLSPLWSLAVLERAFDRKGFFAGSSEFLSLFPGRIGIFLRRSFYRMTLDECADDVHIGFQTTLAHPQMIIGRRVYVGNRCSLGMCRLDEGVTIGSNVDILSGRRQHGFDDPTRPVSEQGGSFSPVHIGRNAWIGNSAVIMADLGEGSVVGAGSVVVKPTPVGAVVVGNPARVVRTRAAA